MSDIPRLNNAIKALESGAVAMTTFAPADIATAQAIAAQPYDAVVFEMEHKPYEITGLRDCLQYMMDRRQILRSGTLAPPVAPMVRIPANGGEMNQWLAKQVLDIGVYGVIWPHVSTVDEARNAVQACRYPRPEGSERFHPAGMRGDSPKAASRYWGISQAEYYQRADVWPLAPQGEVLVGIMCEEKRAIANLPKMLEQVPGIGLVLVGEGDLSQDLGHPRDYEHPAVQSAMNDILAICKEKNVPCGHPHVSTKNVEELVDRGFRWLMINPEQTFKGLEMGRKKAGRT